MTMERRTCKAIHRIFAARHPGHLFVALRILLPLRYVTMERPSMFFDEHGILTHIHLAADMITGDEGCGNRTLHQHFGHCPCDNCKYEDKGGTTIIALDA